MSIVTTHGNSNTLSLLELSNKRNGRVLSVSCNDGFVHVSCRRYVESYWWFSRHRIDRFLVDYVYFEGNPNEPYLIRRIEELNKVRLS